MGFSLNYLLMSFSYLLIVKNKEKQPGIGLYRAFSKCIAHVQSEKVCEKVKKKLCGKVLKWILKVVCWWVILESEALHQRLLLVEQCKEESEFRHTYS